MEIWVVFRQKLATLARRRQLDRDLQDEMEFHLVMREQKLRNEGMSESEARYSAQRAFGNTLRMRETTRDVWMFSWLEHVVQDLRYASRSMRRAPVLATVVVISLALGIGANTAIFSFIEAALLRSLRVRDPQKLVTVLYQEPGKGTGDSFTNALWEAVRDQQNVFSGVFAWSGPQQFDLAQGGAVRNVNGLFVSGGYFATLGVQPISGRLISVSDDQRGCVPVAVLSYGFWHTGFAGAESAVGSSIRLRGHPFQVIGVAPPHFYGVQAGKDFDVAIPLCASAPFDKRNLDSRSRWWLSVMGRMKPELSFEQVRARLELLSPSVMKAAVPDVDAAGQQRFLITTLVSVPGGAGTSELRESIGNALRILMAVVTLVLLIACANIAGLLLARTTARAKEIAIRKALGASRNRLVRQLMTESLLFSLLGAALGMLFARLGSALMVRNLSTGRDPVFLDLSLNLRVLGFTLTVSVLTGLFMGLLPAIHSTRVALADAMKNQAYAGVGERSRFGIGKWIVAGQVALSLVLLVGGALLLRTFVRLIRLDAGFDRSNVLIVGAKPPWWAGDDVKVPPQQRTSVDDQIVRRLRTLAGVVSVSRSFTEPLGDDNWADEIRADTAGAPIVKHVYFNFVAPQYFQTLRTPLLAGRDFRDGDTKNSQPVAIVNETLARKLFSGLNPLGRHFRNADPKLPASWIEIVGIMKDSKYQTLREATKPTVVLPATQAPPRADTEDFLVRTAVEPTTLIPALQHAVAEVNPQISLNFHTLAGQVDDNLVRERLLAVLAGFFGLVGLVLAMMGLYGVLSYTVAQRQVEFGIRMALGARPVSILRLVMRDVVFILAVGITVGLGISLLTVRILQGLLFGLHARDPITIALAVCLLTSIALLAAYLPARRATRVDPMVALRYE